MPKRTVPPYTYFEKFNLLEPRGRRARVPRTKSRLFQRLVIHFRLRRERDHRNDCGAP